MSQNAWQICGVMPTLDVGDLQSAIGFYERLGFVSTWKYPESENLQTDHTHAGMKFGDAVSLMFAQYDSASGPLQRQNLYFFVQNVNELYNHLKQVYDGNLEEIGNHEYGMRDFSIRDPWGHELTFGQSLNES